MPYLHIVTNVAMGTEEANCLAAKASSAVAGLLGKPESVMLSALTPGTAMTFGGTDAPTAYVELKSIGLAPEQCGKLARALCDFLAEALRVAPDRVYIEFSAINGKMFGWNGKTF